MKTLFTATLLSASLAAASATAADVDVMTQNQYLGADIAPLLTAPTPGEFFQRVGVALGEVAANRPRERIAALAAEIAARQPDLVGLQEVFSFSCSDAAGGAICSQLPFAGAFNDHLQLTLLALRDSYQFVGQVTNLDVSLPFEVAPGAFVLITVVDRDVILAQQDVAASIINLGCAKSSDDGCNYATVLGPIPPLGISVERGYVAALAWVRGVPYVFINTHLETRNPIPAVQAAQAAEHSLVVQALMSGGAHVITVGDFNSSPNDPAAIPGVLDSPYGQLSTLLTDAWLMRPGNAAGLSCCQLADLSNHQSQLYERIDLIWSSVLPLKVKQARVIGATVDTKTQPPGRGLWPSDHGAVAATLQFP